MSDHDLTPEEATALVAALDRLEQFGLRVSQRQRTARDKLRSLSSHPDEWAEATTPEAADDA